MFAGRFFAPRYYATRYFSRFVGVANVITQNISLNLRAIKSFSLQVYAATNFDVGLSENTSLFSRLYTRKSFEDTIRANEAVSIKGVISQ